MKITLKTISTLGAAVTMSAWMCLPAFSAGSAGLEVGLDNARVLAKGNTGVADPQDASTQIFNPAGLTQLEHSGVMANYTLLIPDYEYVSTSGSGESGATTPSHIPAFALAYKTPIENLVIGLSANSPYGLSDQFSSTGSFRYIGYSNQLQEIAYTIDAAYEILPGLSVAAGFTYADIDLKQSAKLNSTFITNIVGLNPPDANAEWDLAGRGYGWNVALFWEATDRLSFGAMYRSELAASIEGELNVDNIQGPVMTTVFGGSVFRTSADTDVTLPDSVVVGAAYKLDDKTTVELDLGWTGWSDYEQFNFVYGTSNAVLALNNPALTRYDDTISVNVGIAHKLSDSLTILGGYAYFEQAATESDYNNIPPDGDRHSATVGFEIPVGKGKLSFAYCAQFQADLNIDNSVGAGTAGVSIDGEYDNIYHIVSTSISYPLG